MTPVGRRRITELRPDDGERSRSLPHCRTPAAVTRLIAISHHFSSRHSPSPGPESSPSEFLALRLRPYSPLGPQLATQGHLALSVCGAPSCCRSVEHHHTALVNTKGHTILIRPAAHLIQGGSRHILRNEDSLVMLQLHRCFDCTITKTKVSMVPVQLGIAPFPKAMLRLHQSQD